MPFRLTGTRVENDFSACLLPPHRRSLSLSALIKDFTTSGLIKLAGADGESRQTIMPVYPLPCHQRATRKVCFLLMLLGRNAEKRRS